MKDYSIKNILNEAHIKALSRSLNKEALKKEAANYEPMTMLGVGHVQTIVKELLTEFELRNKIKVELELMNSLIKAASNNYETSSWLLKHRLKLSQQH